MEFRAPTVYYKKNPKARISGVGAVLLVAAVFLTLMDGYEKFALWTFGASILIFFIGVVVTKGDLTNVGVANAIQLAVSTEGIRIGNAYYPMGQINNIEFDIEGYAGMHAPSIAIVGAESDGMGNHLRFEHTGQPVECRFYLGGLQHAQQLGMLFRTFYEQHVPFVERRGLYRTFLLERMSEKELKENLLKF
ncbi:hypothetical protein Q4E93_21605 [Flavitalea sp. BT771]|uniref:hypothetical protein n=1 Tax=Flavitalea sp. BT771 TaxID=3063329 RepID=UPI0026E127BB|nr:hypothetical protein [Flavitalea sp. BT771]MDO6433221.1 hypothetical protein [Flavitalea sp. BT771]MDV6221503.1 hypothetical protein [Flavitalea sp. BT771]